MGTAWSAYTMENRGRFPEYVWHTPKTPEVAWRGYWLGIIEKSGVTPETLLCPAAREAASKDALGFGSATRAWTGEFVSDGSAVRLSDEIFRTSSYGYNKYLTVGGGSGRNGMGSGLAALPNGSNTPLMFDCAFADAQPPYSTASVPAKPPPDLTGAALAHDSPEHWRFLLARHGRGINVVMADGSARWVRLDDAYQLSWSADWVPYRLQLPAK
jgi:prepilin-type processing-associated H-X9-DG protein